ncbi:MAG: ABC transporter ATP-binding protein [Anaerolineae bacterium]|nr:ABC transporter ATP-binding protein [Anaerolineae bacterium]
MSDQQTALLQTMNLSTGYRSGAHRSRQVSHGLTLTLCPGELVCLIGPNGAGKSTLIRTLAGMHSSLRGAITLGGRRIDALSRRELAQAVSVVLTGRIEAGDMTVAQLVSLGRYAHTNWFGTLTEADRRVIHEAMEAVGILSLAERNVGELSDGEQQKTLIARALAQDPAVLLLDEPTAYLDLPHRVEVMKTLRGLARHGGRAILLSTHDLDLALRSADRLWLMASDGSLHTGAPEDLVLSGVFQNTFHREGVSFDPYTGSFSMSNDQSGVVALNGSGIPALWTTRALERVGFCVVENAIHSVDVPQVTLEGSERAVRWRITHAGRSQYADSIHMLIIILQTMRPATSGAFNRLTATAAPAAF